MRTKILSNFLYFTITFLLVSFSDPYSKKRISDDYFRYEFYVTAKNISPKPNKVYYWFKGGAIHSAEGGFAGDLLNDVFLKTYHSNQIAEYGCFKNGLKVGVWKTWHPNGAIESTQKWTNGVPFGVYKKYDKSGALIERGSYKNGKKQGKWYDYAKKDTTIYNNGIPKIKKQKLSKLDKLTLQLQTLKDDAEKKNAIEAEKNKIAAAKNAEKDFIKTQETALKNEKAKIKLDKKEAKEAKIAARKNKKEAKERAKNIEQADKKENFLNRFFGKLFGQKNNN